MRRGIRSAAVFVALLLLGSGAAAEAEPALNVQSLQPAQASPGAEVTIRGSGFGSNRRAVRVTLGGRPLPIRSVSPSAISVTVPPNASSGMIEVRVGRRRARAPQPLQVVAPLRVISFSPTSGGAGTEVTIRGSGFELPPSNNDVTLTGVDCPVVGGSATELRVRIPERGVRTGPFEISTRSGASGRSTSAFTVTGAPAPAPTHTGQGRPVIDRFEPRSGPPGTVVQIIGRNFDRRLTVSLSGQRLSIVEFQPTRLTVEVPQGARSGRFTLRGRFTVESRQRFNVVEQATPPVIASFSPDEGPPGTRVEITGERFGSQTYENRVMIAGRPCIVRAASPERLVVEVPAQASSGPFTVQVRGAGEATSDERFTVFAALTITSLEPTNGPVGTEVTLEGTGFVPDEDENRVTINGRPAEVVEASETELVFEVPRGATSGPVEVVARDHRRRARDPFRITVPPVVRRFSPTSGAPGTEVTVYGQNFGSSSQALDVRLGSTECRVLSVGPTQARVAVPEGASSGPFEVEVRSQGADESSQSFTVYTPLTISEFTPTRGPTGTDVTIRGTGFSPTTRNNIVRIGGRPTRVTAAGETELRVQVPRGVTGGTIRVQIRGRSSVESEEEFVVTHAPVVARVRPNSGAPGTEVTILGDHFGSSMDEVRVTLAGTPCPLESVRQRRITLTVPANASTGSFQVTRRGQGSGESRQTFSVEAPLTIAGFTPSGGEGGSEVTITGSGFSPRARFNQVYIGDNRARVLSASEDSLRVRIPSNATTGRFRVVTRGRGETRSNTSFRVQVALSVDSFSPSAGQPGTEVTITGSGLSQDGLQVLLAGRPVEHRSVSDSELRLTVPSNAHSGPFVVRVPRMGEARSRSAFNVTDPPVLTAMSPTGGPPGAVVTLEGRNFNPLLPRNTARIGETTLRIESVSPTQMRVRIPAGASSGPITVEVQGAGHATTRRPFRVTQPDRSAAPPPQPSPPSSGGAGSSSDTALTVQGFSPRSGPPGTLIQILGDGWGSRPQDIRVWIGSVEAPVAGVRGRMLTVRVPNNAQTGPLRIVRRNVGSAQTPVPFTVRR